MLNRKETLLLPRGRKEVSEDLFWKDLRFLQSESGSYPGLSFVHLRPAYIHEHHVCHPWLSPVGHEAFAHSCVT